jgi:aspartate/methionine/tyrosine aminotransferase
MQLFSAAPPRPFFIHLPIAVAPVAGYDACHLGLRILTEFAHSRRRGIAVKVPFFLAKLLIHLGIARRLPRVQRLLDGGADHLHYYGDRLLAAPLDLLPAAADFLDRRGPEVVDLSEGAPRFDLLPSGGNKLPAERRGWPLVGGLPELRAAVADKLLADNCLAFDAHQEILITAGVLGAAQLVFDAFVNRGDRVVLFDPCSPLYALTAQTREARLHWLPTWMEDGRTRFRPDHLARALNGAKLVVVNSPANPTGGVLAPDDLEQLAFWAQRFDCLILSDEVFERYHYETEPVSIGSLPSAKKRTLTTGSVSKSHALTAARVGWLAAPRHLLKPCTLTAALRAPFVPTMCQQLALTALRTRGEVFDEVRDEFAGRRRYAWERLRGLDLNPAWPAGAFFFWIPVWQLGLSGRAFVDGLLHEQNVLLTPGECFGPSGMGYVRLSYAGDEGRLHEGLNRLAAFVQQYQPPRAIPLPVAA